MSSETSTDRAQLSVDVTCTADSIVVVTFAGEIDRTTCADVQWKIGEVLDRLTPQRISLDLSDVTFLDSGGIRVLVEALEETRRRGGDLDIRRAHRHVYQVLDITGLLGVFHLGPA